MGHLLRCSRKARSWRLLAFAALVALSPVQGNEDCTRIDFIPMWTDQSPARGACDGFGTCVAGLCECEPGHFGRADFYDATGVGCQMDSTALRVMYFFSLLVTVVLYVLPLRLVLERREQFKFKQAEAALAGRRYTLVHNRGMLAIAVHYCITAPSMAAFAILKMANPERSQIGLDPGATFLFFTAKAGLYFCIWCIQPALIATIAQGTRGTRSIVRRAYRVSGVLSGMGVLASFFPFLTLMFSDGKDSTAVAVFYLFFGTTVLHVSCLGVQAWDTKRSITEVLERSVAAQHSEKTAQVKSRLVALQNEAMRQSSMQVALWLSFLLLSPLAHRHDYCVPLAWVALSVLGKRLAETTVVDHQRYKKSSTGGSSHEFGSFAQPASYEQTGSVTSVPRRVFGSQYSRSSFSSDLVLPPAVSHPPPVEFDSRRPSFEEQFDV